MITDGLKAMAITLGVLTPVILALATLTLHQKGTIAELEQERSTLNAQLKAQAEAMARADTEVAQLSRKLQAMRKRATAREDKLNGQLKESAKSDDCLNRTVDRAIIDLLRQQGGDK